MTRPAAVMMCPVMDKPRTIESLSDRPLCIGTCQKKMKRKWNVSVGVKQLFGNW